MLHFWLIYMQFNSSFVLNGGDVKTPYKSIKRYSCYIKSVTEYKL